MFYDTVIRNKYKEFWEKLKTAWVNSFGSVIDDRSLATIPIAGKHRFTHVEVKWIAESCRFLKLNPYPGQHRSALYLSKEFSAAS